MANGTVTKPRGSDHRYNISPSQYSQLIAVIYQLAKACYLPL